MNMKPIALLIGGVLAAAPAFAQSNVTIYGRADFGLMSRSGDSGGVPDTNGKTEFASGLAGASRLGFRGSEDLGSGLKAIFELEYGTAIDQGTTTSAQWGNRHTWVGLSSNDYGTIIGGRIDGLRTNRMFFKYDPFANFTVGNFGQMTPQVDRYDNSLVYASPSFGGVTVSLAYSSQARGQENIGNRGDNRLMGVGLAYDKGPLSLAATYERIKTQGADDNLLWLATIGGAYDFGVVKVSAIYDKIKSDDGNTLIMGHDQTSWMLAVKAPVGPSVDLRAMYGDVSYDEFRGVKANDLDATKWGIGMEYKLSKRTYLYADYGSIHNDKNATNTIAPVSTAYLNGYGTRGFDLGLAHRF